MVVYSFHVFDRHTECIYSKSWIPQDARRAAPATSTSLTPPAGTTASGPPVPTSGLHGSATAATASSAAAAAARRRRAGDNNAKLMFGVVHSLRTMVRQLGGEDDAFIGYRTPDYKLHYYETASNLRFVMLTDPATLSMRNVLHQIYINLWVEYVVKNPLSPVEHKGGEGVNNELFELGLDQFIRGLM